VTDNLSPKAAPAGDSAEQRAAEKVLLAALSEKLGVVLLPIELTPPDGLWALQVDGACDSVLCEIYAHLGKLKPAQEHKVLHDAAKLRYAERLLGAPRRKLLVFADPLAAAPFLDKRWKAQALVADGIEVIVLDLPPELREQVRLAQIRQYR